MNTCSVTIQKKYFPLRRVSDDEYKIRKKIGFKWHPKRYLVINSEKVYCRELQDDKKSGEMLACFECKEYEVVFRYCKSERTIVPLYVVYF
jgi:hypothetical protein